MDARSACITVPAGLRVAGQRIASLACCLTLAAASAVSAAGAASAADPPTRRALLIGINDYALPQIPKLRGAVSDVQMIGRILETRLGFEHRNIVILTDAQATRAGILNALDDLIDKTNAGDTVYFHYSGHGSQVQDPDGGPDGGLDETIVAQDSRMPGVPDIVEDELASRFRKFRSRNVLLVFDSCHSGSITRSGSPVQPRAIAPDTRLDLYQRRSAATTRSTVVVEQLPHVLMASVPADEEALDAEIDGGFYGVFTYALARSLDANGPDGTPEAIHRVVKQELNRIQQQLHLHPPEPQLEAPAALLTTPILAIHNGGSVLSATSTASASANTAAGATATDTAVPAARPGRRAWLETSPIDADNLLLLDGAALNARPGSQWVLYGPGDTTFRFGDGLAVGTVRSLSGADALLHVHTRRLPVPSGARAIAAAPPDVSKDVPLRIAGVADERERNLFQAVRKGVAGVRRVGDGEFYRLRVENRAGVWHVLDAAGITELQSFTDAGDADVAAKLAGLLQRWSRAVALLALDNPASDLTLNVGVRTEAADQKSRAMPRDIVAVASDFSPTYRARRPGEARSAANSLVIEVRTDRPLYITVVDVDSQGGVSQLFPNPHQKPDFLPEGLVPANQVIAIPDGFGPGTRAGFHWDYGPPPGTDTVRVFAASDLKSARVVRRAIAKATADSRALDELGSTLIASTVRGVHVTTDDEPAGGTPATSAAGAAAANPTATAPPGDWSASSIVIQVRE